MSERSHDGYTILVVDDDPDALAITKRYLGRHGHHVLVASSAEEALNVFLANEVHLLIVDYVMPGMDGAQLVRAIRGFDPFIQIVIQTAHAVQRPSQQVLDDLDIQGYHDKVEGPQRLMAWVTVCLRAYRLIRRLRERERAQLELISNLSHEFRTPLGVTHGYVDLLLEGEFGPLPSAAREPLCAVERTVQDLRDIIDNVVEHTRLEAGATELSLGGVDIGPLVDELQRLGGRLLQERPVALSVHVEPGLPIVQSDGQKLRTILRNLLSNAVKFTARGSIEVRAGCHGEHVVIEVRDTGAGIAAERLEAVFDPFRQVDGSSTRRHGGLGLGLALSRQYARLLGGDLAVESAPGTGTSVTLTIPAIAGITSFSTSVSAEQPARTMDAAGRREAIAVLPEPPGRSWRLWDYLPWRPIVPTVLDWSFGLVERLTTATGFAAPPTPRPPAARWDSR